MCTGPQIRFRVSPLFISLSLFLCLFRGLHFNLCSFVGLFNMPVTCRCHASTCRPSSGYGNYLLRLPPATYRHKSQSILHNAMRAWLNGEVHPLAHPLPLHSSHITRSDVFGFFSLCLHLPHGAARRGLKTFYAAFVLLLHSTPQGWGDGGRLGDSNCTECIRVNPLSGCALLRSPTCSACKSIQIVYRMSEAHVESQKKIVVNFKMA